MPDLCDHIPPVTTRQQLDELITAIDEANPNAKWHTSEEAGQTLFFVSDVIVFSIINHKRKVVDMRRKEHVSK